MASEDRERIFQEFTRLPGAQGEEGFGQMCIRDRDRGGDFAEDHNSTSLESDFCFPAFRFPVIVGRSGLWSTAAVSYTHLPEADSTTLQTPILLVPSHIVPSFV